MIIQLTGLSGAGKSTIAKIVKSKLESLQYKVEIIDGDDYRETICSDLGFSKEDRIENIKRLGYIAKVLSNHKIIVLLAAIAPYESSRKFVKNLVLKNEYKEVYIECSLEELKNRDVKGLYARALLPESDIYEKPENPDYIIITDEEIEEQSGASLSYHIIEWHIKAYGKREPLFY